MAKQKSIASIKLVNKIINDPDFLRALVLYVIAFTLGCAIVGFAGSGIYAVYAEKKGIDYDFFSIWGFVTFNIWLWVGGIIALLGSFSITLGLGNSSFSTFQSNYVEWKSDYFLADQSDTAKDSDSPHLQENRRDHIGRNDGQRSSDSY